MEMKMEVNIFTHYFCELPAEIDNEEQIICGMLEVQCAYVKGDKSMNELDHVDILDCGPITYWLFDDDDGEMTPEAYPSTKVVGVNDPLHQSIFDDLEDEILDYYVEGL